MRVADLLDTAHLRLRLRHEAPGGLERTVGRVMTTGLLEPGAYVAGSSLVLSELAWRRTPADSETFVTSIAEHGVATLVAGTALLGPAPDDLVAACRRHGITLIEVPPDVAFVDVTDHLARVSSAESGDRLSARLVRQRELLASMADGRRLEEIVARVARDVGHACRALSGTGRVVAGEGAPLPPSTVDRLVQRFLATSVLPVVVPVDEAAFSLFAVGSGLGQRLTGWMLAVEGDHHDWPREQVDALEDLAAIVALDRTRQDERLLTARALATEVVALVEGGAPTAEAASRLRRAGLSPEGSMVVAAVDLVGTARESATAVVEDLALQLGPPVVASCPDGTVVAVLPDSPDLSDRLRAGFARLAPGLGREDRLAVGLSSPATVGALAGALDEARYAVHAARAAGSRVSVVDSEEVTSHRLLLAAVPDDVRRAFAARVLGAVVDHDERSGTDLLPTLRTFLACSGSWTRTAEAMHLHVNTVRYRIERIQDLTGRDLALFDDRVDVFLALESL